MTKLHTLQTVRKHSLAKLAVAFCASAVLAASAIAQIASGTTGIDTTGNAASEMAACKNGKTQQSRETCMIEVRNANAEKRAGRIDNAGGQYKANAMLRCNAFKAAEDKAACEARVTGAGSPSGSVAGGGAITQVESVIASPAATAAPVPATAAAPAPAPAASQAVSAESPTKSDAIKPDATMSTPTPK